MVSDDKANTSNEESTKQRAVGEKGRNQRAGLATPLQVCAGPKQRRHEQSNTGRTLF